MSNPAREVDIRSYPAWQRNHVVLRAFDGLKAGETMLLVDGRDPKPLLFELQEQRPWSFDWSVLQAGPDRHRVEIRRRTKQGPGGVMEYLTWDHRRLDGILADARRVLERGSCARAAERFAEFCCGWGRHVDMEEQILLPIFEQVTGVGGNPMAATYSEHEAANRLCEEIVAALAAGDRREAALRLEHLREMLLVHNLKEEELLYPMSDRLAAGERGRWDLVRWMQAL